MIDVIIPVYDGVAETRRCLESVRRSLGPGEAEVIVVDDATPRPELARLLDDLTAQEQVTLLRNEANRGFVHSVNRGMALHADRDVVLLNSDTAVANDWLARLRAAAYRGERVATVTPFSNNATICSYPYEGWGGGVPGTLGLDELDRIAAKANAGATVEIPTAVGFCMFIRRAALDAVGLFDAERFGRGYGEENDFCMRAATAGWRHVLAADTFVFHQGAVSFSGEREALLLRSADALNAAHPRYAGLIHAFIARDPIAPLRDAIDAERAGRGAEEAKAVLRERASQYREAWDRLQATIRERDERATLIAQLREGLAEATQIVEERSHKLADREQALRERDAEIARLHDALAAAESLAFARADELERIRRFWLWRFYWRAMSWGTDPARKDG